MMKTEPFEIFLACAPGLESVLAEEALECGFEDLKTVAGGVVFEGLWPDVWRANLVLRGASRVLARIAQFRAQHLAVLDKRARRVDWSALVKPGTPISVEATCRGSRIYHNGAAAQRVANAISDTLKCPVSADAKLVFQVRIHNDFCTISVDTSGELLHRRGFKEAVAKAPMRETLAALFLRAAGYTGQGAVLDPMCGSGTFVMEAAEKAIGLQAGRARAFAFEHLANFDREAFTALKSPEPTLAVPTLRHFGSDRDAGAIRMSAENAKRAGLEHLTQFACVPISDLQHPDCEPGLIIINPPYGDRISNRGTLVGVHRTLGLVLRERFSGWRVAMVTSEIALAKKTGLPFDAPGPWVDHGGIKVRLFQTPVLS